MIKCSIHQQDKTIINIYAPKIRAPKYLKESLAEMKRKTHNTMIVGDVNTPFPIMDRTSRQKINKEREDQYSNIDQTIHRDKYINYTQQQQNKYSSPKHTEYSLAYIRLGHKTSVNKFRNIEVSSQPQQNEFEMNRRKYEKNSQICENKTAYL